MADEIYLILVDVDGCTINVPLELNENDIHQWFFATNRHMLPTLLQQIKTGAYQKVILAAQTKRQDYRIDDINSKNTASVTGVLPLLQSYAATELGIEIVLETALNADFLANDKNGEGTVKVPGDSYKAICRTRYSHVKQPHAVTLCDANKIPTHYLQIHRAACFHPEAKKIIVTVLDDEKRLISQVLKFFASCPQLLPSNVVLRFYQYTGPILKRIGDDIIGTGKIDRCYEWSFRYLVSRSYLFSGAGLGDYKHLKTAEELIKFHVDNHIRQPGIRSEMKWSDSPESFLEFRDKVISPLHDQCQFSSVPSYTTAQQLAEQGLIPENFVIRTKGKVPLSAVIPEHFGLSASELHASYLATRISLNEYFRGLLIDEDNLAKSPEQAGDATATIKSMIVKLYTNVTTQTSLWKSLQQPGLIALHKNIDADLSDLSLTAKEHCTLDASFMNEFYTLVWFLVCFEKEEKRMAVIDLFCQRWQFDMPKVTEKPEAEATATARP